VSRPPTPTFNPPPQQRPLLQVVETLSALYGPQPAQEQASKRQAHQITKVRTSQVWQRRRRVRESGARLARRIIRDRCRRRVKLEGRSWVVDWMICLG
ncbi:MAG: hypothetical protein M1830_009724, partial [Pleopsidium flavum]